MQQVHYDYKTWLSYLFILDVVRHIRDKEITDAEVRHARHSMTLNTRALRPASLQRSLVGSDNTCYTFRFCTGINICRC